MLLAILSIGGILGTLGRYYLSRTIQNAGFVQKLFGYHFPMGIFCVNILGCFFAGIVYALEEIEPYPLVLFLFTGILGAFTTFSTFGLESFNLIREGEIKYAVINILASNIAGIALVFIGYIASKYLFILLR